MSFNFQLTDTDDVNAANPCCCPEAACIYATAEYNSREVDQCKGGFYPFWKTEAEPGGFDSESIGKLMPLYKTRLVTLTTAKKGNSSETWKNSDGHTVSETFIFKSTVSFTYTVKTSAEWQQTKEHWPAGNQSLSTCPPGNSIYPGKAEATGAIIGATENGTVTITLQTPDIRPTVPLPEGTTGDPSKAGVFQFEVDGIGVPTTGEGNEAKFYLNKDDATCHSYQVRHICGGTGQWSKPFMFSLHSNPCCKEPDPPACNEWTEGNPQSSMTQEEMGKAMGGSWTSSYESDSSSTSDEGTFGPCDGTVPDNIPYALRPTIFNSTFIPTPPLQYIFFGYPANGVDGYTDTNTTTPDETSWVQSWNVSDNATTADNEAPGWWCSNFSENGTASIVHTTKLSDNQNAGTSSVDALFSKALSILKGYSTTYAWSGGASAARATGCYPETQGNMTSLQIWAHVREIRFRWNIPADHIGTFYRTIWNISRFHDAWVVWRGEYYQWAVKQYAFLNHYPGAEKPGPAPVEPQNLRPEIKSGPTTWEWSSSQGEQSPESISQCDPTKRARTLTGPALEAAKEASKRQSPWHIVTPDKWCDWRAKPSEVQPLPKNANAYAIKQHEKDVATYKFLLDRYKTTHHAELVVCNVRHVCVESPHGTIENYDHRFPTTTLPPLDPTKEDPSRWSKWY